LIPIRIYGNGSCIMKNLFIENWSRAGKIAFSVFCAALFMGAFVPLLVDFLMNGHFGWSLIVLGAIGMAWGILAPWFLLRRARAALSWAAAAVSVPVFLWIVESLGTNKGWFLPLGLPATVTGLAALGGILWICKYSRRKFWYAAAPTFILISLLSLLEYTLARLFMQFDPSESMRQIVAIGLVGVSPVLALEAVFTHKLQPFKDRQE
jgi:hypothetical protein